MKSSNLSTRCVSHAARVFKLERQLVESLCENIDSPRSLAVYLLLKYENWEALMDLSTDSRNYDCRQRFADDYLVSEILKKNPRVPLNIDRADVALRKFLANEEVCRETNIRLSNLRDRRDFPDDEIFAVFSAAQARISSILGDLRITDLQFMESNMRFGPGATTSLSGVVTQGRKYSRRLVDATPRVAEFLLVKPKGWTTIDGICHRRSSKLTTVPKNAKTDRVICIEPDLNIFVQLGSGALIRKKLADYGLDLSTQTKNQELARVAHTFGLCTMDLSSASDTIARELVWALLPFNWAESLHFSRVDFTSINGREVALEKWSSMGNGYTFELETLLFYSIVLAACDVLGLPECVKVYGDDLIFPNEASPLVTRALNFFGFSVNSGKTFGEGCFHESCGTDWFEGVNVRPFYLRSDSHDFESICFLYGNLCRRYAHRRNGDGTCDARFLPVWLICFRAVKPYVRHLIPEGVGDGGFAVDFDFAKPTTRKRLSRDGWSGVEYTFRYIPTLRKVISSEGSLIAFLSGLRSDFTCGVESLRGRYQPATPKTGYVLTWPNLGPWVTRV